MDKIRRSQDNADDDDSASACIDKAKILQDAKECFGANSEKTSRLVDVLTRCIHLMLRGERLTHTEATDLFFLITRLFQYKNNTLRRLTFIAIKALHHHQAENVYVVTPSLLADANSSQEDPAVRASALRALSHLADVSSIEQHLRQAIVDKHPVVASAALTSLIHIAQHNSEVIKRCTNEIEEAMKSDSPMVQYHALALRYMSCKNDRLATSRMLKMCVDQKPSSPLAICLLLRLLSRHINNSPSGDDRSPYTSYILGCLNDGCDMVKYEAACSLLYRPQGVAHLRGLLTSPKAALRFAAVRQLNNNSSLDTRCWSIHRIGNLCKLHLLTKRYKPGDEIIGMLEFIKSSLVCTKYTCTLQCESAEMFEVKQEFTLGYKQSDFFITIPETLMAIDEDETTLHCVLSFLFYITDRNYPRALFEDKAGTIELAPNEIETKQFSCDFPILINSRVNTCITGANV